MSEKMRDVLALQAALDALRADGRGLVKAGMEYEVARIVRDALAEQPTQRADKGDLLPCPFCGTAARFDWEERRGQNFYYAVCPKNDCVARMGTDYCNTKAEAAAIWNRRTALAEQPAQGVPVARTGSDSFWRVTLDVAPTPTEPSAPTNTRDAGPAAFGGRKTRRE